jgi:hypothetical protein
MHPLSPILGFCVLGFTTHYLIWDYHPRSIGDYTPFILIWVFMNPLPYLGVCTTIFCWVYASYVFHSGIRTFNSLLGFTTRYLFGIGTYHLFGFTHPISLIGFMHPLFSALHLFGTTTRRLRVHYFYFWAYAPIIFHLGSCTHHPLFGLFTDLVIPCSEVTHLTSFIGVYALSVCLSFYTPSVLFYSAYHPLFI